MDVKSCSRILPVFLLLFTCSANGQQGASQGEKAEQNLSKPKVHVVLGGISVGTFYAAMPYFAPYYPDSLSYPAYFYPAPFYSAAYLARSTSQGKVKLQASPKDAYVYINGAYAGTARQLKSFPLVSGAYDLEVKASGYRTFHKRIYILSNRTLHIAAHLKPLSP